MGAGDADTDSNEARRQMPLEGVKVLEFTGLGPTPFGAMMLCDLGASGIRIERAGATNPLGGDPKFDFLFRGRPSLELDIKSQDGLEKILYLVQEADVLIEGYRPGTMERLGLGPDRLCEINERLVYARMSGWGQEGPLSQKAGHDINYLALSGGLNPIGPFDRTPTPPLNLVGNFGGGGMFMVVGVLAALNERQRSGRGQVLDVAMIDGISVLLTQLSGWMQMGQWNPGRGGNLLDGSAYFYRCYETADGRHIAVGALERQFHDAFLTGLGFDPLDFDDYLNPEHWASRAELLGPVIKTKTMTEWEVAFAGLDACVTPVLTLEEASRSETNRTRGSIIATDLSFQPRPAPRFSSSSLRYPDETVTASPANGWPPDW
ncbi:CaiB/BaiF CoA-transferase family protein [Erythrobacter sp. AP23]|uniref:CaiB/BaiF CoA transferase family protein n=1 Tax=Erythrobacter sp. AP23 TaxID=499656 RepID=UPI000ABAF1DE|nr:CaiB/BaiF CoA-transferase family protein [Erythrobacter sp. AP23]